ncbi:MAG: glutathione S-transferase N-terminal domain-containing protein [Nevskiaceae bacterium]|jgi:RNA polymerase-associated protein|nr:glutathione S-transferase N-terminal domain-containing protein [Nevskiaceae bacterium]
MTLFSAPDELASHRTRIVLAEKDVEIEIVSVTPGRLPEDLLDLNPDHSLPTLVDRDLVLYDSRVIIEYLDERFPHPPLMPVDPVSRAHFRLALHRIERDWYGIANKLVKEGPTEANAKQRSDLRDMIIQTADFVRDKPYFISDELSLVDVSIAPILWRLRLWDIELPRDVQPLQRYMNKLFSRPAFRLSLSEQEREMQLG